MAVPFFHRRALPWRFRLWWVAATASSAGDAMLAFALIWLASGHGTAAVALTSTLALLPRMGFMLLGGVLGDRYGPQRSLLVTQATQVGVLLVLLALSGPTPGAWVLATTAFATGVLSAFQQPAATVFPRLLLRHEDQLPRALARISGSIQLARILGVPLGGLLVAARPLTVVLALDAVSVLLALLVVLILRPAADGRAAGSSRRRSLGHELVDGLRAASRLRVWALLGAVALVCAAVLPTIAVLVPITARTRGWTAAEAARIDAGWAVGILAVTLVVSWTSTLGRPRVALVGGPAACAVGLTVLAATPSPVLATVAAVLVGCGTALFTTHVAPALIRLAPTGQLTRFQSLLGMVQLLPPALLSAPYAALGHLNPAAALGGAALLALVAAAVALRRVQRPSVPDG